MKKIILGVFFFFVSTSLYSASYDPSLKWETIKTDHFSIHYADKLKKEANLAAKYLEEAHTTLSPKFDWKPWGRTEVILTDNNDTPNGITSTLPYNWIILRITTPDPDNLLASYDNWLRTLIFHEYTHIMHIDQYGGVMTIPRYILGKVVSPNGSVPGWIREGITTYMETAETSFGRGRSSYTEMLLRTAVLEDKFLKIDEADGLQWKWPSFQSMYFYGVGFTEYLAQRFGEDKILEFHKRVGRSPFLYMINHHARHVFNNIEFESKKVHTRYSKVKKEGNPESETFYDLWNDWHDSLKKKYGEQKAAIGAKGLTKFEDVAWGGTVLGNPAISPDGKYLVYSRSRVKGPSEMRLIDIETGVDKVIRKKQIATTITFSPDSKKIYYSAMGVHKRYNAFSDIHSYDIEGKKFEQLTKGLRASDPTVSFDGKKIAFVEQDAGTSWLATYDIEKKETADLLKLEDYTQFASPSWSPDGKTLAVSGWVFDKAVNPATTGGGVKGYPAGSWDLYLVDVNNTSKTKPVRLTKDSALDSRPSWSKDGKNIYFVSDRNGISNVYKINRQTKRVTQLTNVLTGIFHPAVSPDEKTLYVQYYNGNGYEIKKTDLSSAGFKPSVASAPVRTFKKDESQFNLLPKTEELTAKKYSPFGKGLFLPRFIIPNVATLGDAVYLSAFTGGADPIRRHNWMGGVTYRTDLSSHIGYFFNYWYNRYKPVFIMGMMAYPVKYSNYTFNNGTTTYTKYLFEERLRGYGGISMPFDKFSLGLTYFFEDRDSNLTQGEYNGMAGLGIAPNLGRYAGITASFGYGQVEAYPSSISKERGRRLRAHFTITDRYLGSYESNEQRIFAGDYREYISLPWTNHVLALRTSGGMTWGDALRQGTFSLGGALGEGMFGGGDSLYYFPLRGLPIAALSSTRALLFSGEYRIPLMSPQRGLGTTPFYIQNIHFAPFVDYGNAWSASTNTWGEGKHFFDNFFLGTGAEIRGDFILGHGLPVTGRLGYGVILVNRDRLGTIKDPLIGTNIKNGTLVLQLGTAF